MVLIEDLDSSDSGGRVEHHVYNSRGQRKLPAIILTGYLGSGKTTLLNYILKEQRGRRLAVIENEVGEVSVDDALLEGGVQSLGGEDVVVLDNGCVCCNIRGDLVKALAAIAEKHAGGRALDGVVIELTGLADPAPVVQSFFMADAVSEAFYIDNVVVLADAKHVLGQLAEGQRDPTNRGTPAAQIAFSSTVLLNKTDLVDEAHLSEVEHRLREVNPSAAILRCQHSRVPVSKLFNVAIFSLGRALEEQYMDEEEFRNYYTPKMDRSVSNVGIRCAGAVNLRAFEAFLDKYLDSEATAKDFLRVKGVLDIAGSGARYVVQCVHMVRAAGFADPWRPGAARENRLIFIGRGMQERRQALTEEFMACVSRPLRFSIAERVRVQLRGGAECSDGRAHSHPGHDHGHGHSCEGHSQGQVWRGGVVVSRWDEHNAYRVRLEDGTEVFVPTDEAHLIDQHQ